MVKKRLKTVGKNTNLTPLENEVLTLLTVEFLTVKKIAKRRKTSLNAIYKIRKKLITKGLINKSNIRNIALSKEVENKGGVFTKNPIRLHGEQYHLNVILKDGFYTDLVKSGSSRFTIGNDTVVCYPNTIEVYSNTSFLGSSPAECDVLALNYWFKLFVKLESRLKVLLVKNGSLNISRVKGEYAETNNELAKSVIKEKEKIRVVGVDGKTWLLIDNSFNLSECETVHPINASPDMANTVQPYFNDLRNNEHLLPSEVKAVLMQTQSQLYEVASGLTGLTDSVNGLVSLLSRSKTPNSPVEDDKDFNISKEGLFYVG